MACGEVNASAGTWMSGSATASREVSYRVGSAPVYTGLRESLRRARLHAQGACVARYDLSRCVFSACSSAHPFGRPGQDDEAVQVEYLT